MATNPSQDATDKAAPVEETKIVETEEGTPSSVEATSPTTKSLTTAPSTTSAEATDSQSKEPQTKTTCATSDAAPRQSSAGESSIVSPRKPSAAGETTAAKSSYSPEDASKELSQLVKSGKVKPAEIAACQAQVKDYGALKEKVDKLKSLLGRSAKAQRESKIDLEATQKRLNQALREIERLNQRLDKLQSRPTHMELLMDFETNFDKALLSVGQTGGQDTSATPAASTPDLKQESEMLDNMLLHELGEARARIEKLESLNSAMQSRTSQLESTTKKLQRERDEARNATSRLQMELKMAQMEAEHATRAMQDKAASLEEMQMEIELVTKANAKANMRAAKGEAAASSSKTDLQHVHQLEAQVQALQEWALASAESKRLMQERVKILENKLRHAQGRSEEGDNAERVLFTKQSSLVVGAGDRGKTIVDLGQHAATVDSRFVVLRWKFDSSPSDLNIDFNILKGKCETVAQQNKAEALIKNRTITGGAGGETEGCFNVDNACTLVWNNSKSWVRPRTVKYSMSVVSLK